MPDNNSPPPQAAVLDAAAARDIWDWLGQTAGRSPGAFGRREESPGSTEMRCRVTPGGGDPRESATESDTAFDFRIGGKGEKVR